MKTLTYILLIAAIHGNIAFVRKKELTIQHVDTVMEKLISIYEFEKDTPFSGNISCQGKPFLDCYEIMQTFFENELSIKIFTMFGEKLTQKLEKFKIGVALLVSEKYTFEKSFKDIINLDDSLMYCVIGALSLHKQEKIQIGDLLNDYAFFADLSSLLENADESTNAFKTKFIKTIDQHMSLEKHRALNGYKNMQGDARFNNVDSLSLFFVNLRKEINNYSSAFCELQKELRLSWIQADTWTWRRLANSIQLNDPSTKSSFILGIDGLEVEFETTILEKTKYTYFDFPLDFPLNENKQERKDPKNVNSTKTDSKKQKAESDSFLKGDSNLGPAAKESASTSNDSADVEKDYRVRKLKSILDWKLSIDDHNERVKNLPLVKEKRDQNFKPIVTKSLKELINTRKTNPTSMTVERFYHTVSLTVDMIVSKVIFPRILFYGYRAMTIYFEDMKSNNIQDRDYRFFQQFYVGEQIIIFKHALEMFYSIQPFTFHKETIIDMLQILDFLVKAYMFHIQKKMEPTDPKESVEKIQKYFKDVRFNQDSNPFSSDIQNITINNWDEVYNAVNDSVFLMIHLTEVKKQK